MMDVDDRPNKRRRFLTDSHQDGHQPSSIHNSSPAAPQQRFRQDADKDEQPETLPDPSTKSASVPFDQATFEAFVGDKMDPDALDIIRVNCGNDMEMAVNLFLDGTWKKMKKRVALRSQPTSRSSANRLDGGQIKGFSSEPLQQRSMPESRYIGAFGVEGWATCSGVNMVKHNDVLKIERQKPKLRIGVKNVAGQAKRSDTIVRFTTNGKEIGRLVKQTANWVSTLMDQDICRFEGKCIYAPERILTNETIFIQLKCYLLKTAFSARKSQLADNRAAGLFDQSETLEEMDLRLRQVALVKIFQEIGLVPSRGSATAAANQRQGLLEAAEMDEKKVKEKPKPAVSDVPAGVSSPSEENEDGKVLEQDQLDALYKKAQSFDFNTPEAEPAATFAMTLRRYQKQSLHWMILKEKDERHDDREVSMHPLWEEYIWPIKDHDDQDLPLVPDCPAFYVNPYSGDLSLDFPLQEQHCLGGILADEMGLGKTIQMLSLIHSHKSEVAVKAREKSLSHHSESRLLRFGKGSGHSSSVDAPCTTVVVAPMSLLSQWQSEAENASRDGTLRSMVYYGSEKNVDLRALCCEENAVNAPDVIITSYGVVLSEFNQISARNVERSNSPGLFALNFFRIVLDEGHNIKNRQSKTARACNELTAQHRWILTGTPIVNKLEDLFSLIRFLRVAPWDNFSFWRTFITMPFESANFMRALDVVQTVLEPLVMRRTKDMKTRDGKPLVALPPKKIEVVDVNLSKNERAVYDYIFSRAKRTFFAHAQAGTVMKAFTSIFAQILRLRQSCCHPILVRNQDAVADEEEVGAAMDAAAGLSDDMDLQSLIDRFTENSEDEKDIDAFGTHVLQQIQDEAVNECPICAEEPMIDQTVTGCWHSACKKCLLEYVEYHTDRHEIPKCFNCRKVINKRECFEVIRHHHDPGTSVSVEQKSRVSLQRLGANDSSAKIAALIRHLRDLRAEHPKMKSVVFSQFTSFLSLMEPVMSRAKMRFLRLDGSVPQKARAAVLDVFAKSDTFTILLISLKAGGVGLNLTSAKRVFMMDPWWSFAIEAQAIDRVHRLGQEDEIKVYRFIVKDSVEERMLKIQDRKKFIASSLGMMSDEEKKVQRIEDIKQLLS